MAVYLGIFLIAIMVVCIYQKEEHGSIVIKWLLAVGLVVLIGWTLVYWLCVGMAYGTNIDTYLKNDMTAEIIEYDKFPLVSFGGDFLSVDIKNSSGLFGVVTNIKTNSWFKYMRLYNNDTKRFDKLPSASVFIKEDAMPKTAYLARLKARPKLSFWAKVMYTPPFFLGTYKTNCWVAHVPPGSVIYKFRIEAK